MSVVTEGEMGSLEPRKSFSLTWLIGRVGLMGLSSAEQLRREALFSWPLPHMRRTL
jgi:hypothetical protein